jgi:hypothetical protein
VQVDLILHPLKSELNFPIGEKSKADLQPERWNLPVHLLESVFYASKVPRAVALEGAPGLTAGNTNSRRLLDAIAQKFQRGIRSMCISESPHLVLLHKPFYKEELQQLVARWALVYFVPWRSVAAQQMASTVSAPKNSAHKNKSNAVAAKAPPASAKAAAGEAEAGAGGEAGEEEKTGLRAPQYEPLAQNLRAVWRDLLRITRPGAGWHTPGATEQELQAEAEARLLAYIA